MRCWGSCRFKALQTLLDERDVRGYSLGHASLHVAIAGGPRAKSKAANQALQKYLKTVLLRQ